MMPSLNQHQAGLPTERGVAQSVQELKSNIKKCNMGLGPGEQTRGTPGDQKPSSLEGAHSADGEIEFEASRQQGKHRATHQLLNPRILSHLPQRAVAVLALLT